MKIVFAGTPAIAAESLAALLKNSSHTVVGVLTAPARRVGRGRNQLKQPEVKVVADEYSVPCWQPEKLDAEVSETIKQCQADILVVVAYGVLFKQAFLDLFPLGAINLHPSALPLYRGPSPLNAALLDGLKETAISVQKMVLAMDRGPLLAQESLPIAENDTAATLTSKASVAGAVLLNRVLDEYQNLSPQEQDNSQATFCHLLRKEDGEVDWKEPAKSVYQKWQGYTPWPGLFTYFRGKKLRLLELRKIENEFATDANLSSGFVIPIGKNSCAVQTGEGLVELIQVQIEGKKSMRIEQFLNGNPLNNDILGV